MRTGGWGPALRIAWRTARHHRGRTALVAVLVALPVLVGGFLDVVTRTAQLPDAERVRRFMGAAEAYLEVSWCESLTDVFYLDGRPTVNNCLGERTQGTPEATVDVDALLPDGSVTIPLYPVVESFARVRNGKQSMRMGVRELPELGHPLRDGMIRLRAGRFPTSAGEVMATSAALERLGAEVGDTITVDRGAAAVVVGEYVDPDSLGRLALTGPPGSTGLARDPGEVNQTGNAVSFGEYGGEFLIDLPDGTDVLTLQRALLEHGIILAPRAHVLDPPEDKRLEFDASGVDPRGIALVGLVVGFGLLEVMLLAGTAFAVSARRQVRDLGLVAAAGGEARHIRRIVLAQGVVIGLIGAVVAIPLAIAAVFFGRPWLDRINDSMLGPLDVRPLELVALVLVGLLSGLVAALVPAVTAARLPVLDALNKRFKATSLRARWPRIGVAMVILGVAVSAVGAGLWRDSQIDYRNQIERYEESVRQGAIETDLAIPQEDPIFSVVESFPEPQSDTLPLALMLLGFALAAFGLAVNSPALVAAVARVGRRLPLSVRLALRDAGRHRHRTGPAVAAIMGAVAGSVALSFYVLSDDTKDDREYDWGLRHGQVKVESSISFDAPDQIPADRFTDAVEEASASLPAAEVIPIYVARPPGEGSPYERSLTTMCWVPSECGGTFEVGVSRGDELVPGGSVPADAVRALRAGKAVATESGFVRGGEITIEMWNTSASQPERITAPAVVVPTPEAHLLPAVWISPEKADDLGLTATLSSAVIDTTRVPTRAEEDDAAQVLERALGPDGAYLLVERGYQSAASVAFLVLLGGSAFVTLVGTAIAVALAGAESRADHATLLAVGAEPWRRRLLAMGQAGTVSTLGVGLGVLLGSIVGVCVLGGHEELPFVVPWLTLAQIAVGIPLVGVLIAGVFTRSRLPLERRIT